MERKHRSTCCFAPTLTPAPGTRALWVIELRSDTYAHVISRPPQLHEVSRDADARKEHDAFERELSSGLSVIRHTKGPFGATRTIFWLANDEACGPCLRWHKGHSIPAKPRSDAWIRIADVEKICVGAVSPALAKKDKSLKAKGGGSPAYISLLANGTWLDLEVSDAQKRNDVATGLRGLCDLYGTALEGVVNDDGGCVSYTRRA